jgi:hypothetical protein
MHVSQLSSLYTMALNIPWYRVARIVQTSLAIAVFGASVYSLPTPLPLLLNKKGFSLLTVLCTLLFTIPTLYAFAVAICTFSLAAPYLALAPVYIPQFERQFVIPTVEILSTSLWLTVLAAQADAFSSPLEYTPSLGSSQCIITLAGIEWYVLEASIMIDVHSLSTCRTVPLGYQLLTSSHM